MITECTVSILDKTGDDKHLIVRISFHMSSCSSFREIFEDQYIATKEWKILMQLRFQMSKIMLDFKKATNSIFKLLILKITKIYIYKTE